MREMKSAVEVAAKRVEGGWLATVRVRQRGTTTEHRVTVKDEDLRRYGASDAAELVRRSFDFLLEREPNTSILREFRITVIGTYFPEYRDAIRSR